MGRIIVAIKDNQIFIMDRRLLTEIDMERYTIVTTINRPFNPHNVSMIKEYFNHHPEIILQYYL